MDNNKTQNKKILINLSKYIGCIICIAIISIILLVLVSAIPKEMIKDNMIESSNQLDKLEEKTFINLRV